MVGPLGSKVVQKLEYYSYNKGGLKMGNNNVIIININTCTKSKIIFETFFFIIPWTKNVYDSFSDFSPIGGSKVVQAGMVS